MKKIFIHIGSQKTGTTSIQKTLEFNQDILKKNKLTFVRGHGRLVEMENILKSRIVYSENLSRKLSSIPDNTIISAENFSWIFEKEELQRFKNYLSQYFNEIEIIVYLRRQDQQIISHHNQASKFMSPDDSMFYGNDPYALPTSKEHFRLHLDYYKRVSIWAEVFGKDNITIRIFDKKELLNRDVVSDFFNVIGISDFQKISNFNESSGLEKAKVGFLMNQAKISRNSLLRNIINRNLDSHTKLLPKREDAQRFYEQYRESNIALNKMFNISENEAIFNEDFSMYPKEGSELWTEEGVNETMTTIFKSLNETYGTINYNVLFQAAVKLEKSDFNLSYEMLKLLQRLIPNDPNIHKKMKSYELFIQTMNKK